MSDSIASTSDELAGRVAIVTGSSSGIGEAQGRALLDATIDAFGRLDILVNNAGWTTAAMTTSTVSPTRTSPRPSR